MNYIDGHFIGSSPSVYIIKATLHKFEDLPSKKKSF